MNLRFKNITADAQLAIHSTTTMSHPKNVHVTHRANGSWAAISEGSSRAAGLHQTQAAAIQEARQIAINNRSELVIHDRDNRIRDKDSFGNDPCPPRDTRN